MLELPEEPQILAAPRARTRAAASRSVARGALAAAIACVLITGCSLDNCPQPCPIATFGLHALDDSTLTWTYKDQPPPQTSTGFVDPPIGNDCSFSFSPGRVVPADSSNGERVSPGTMTLACAGGPGMPFKFLISALGDLRSLESMSLPAPFGSVALQLEQPGKCTDLSLNGIGLTVTVESATGGPAPFPQVVTSDFVRTFRLDLDTTSATASERGFGPCDVPVTGNLSLHFEQTAADYVADPAAVCYCQ